MTRVFFLLSFILTMSFVNAYSNQKQFFTYPTVGYPCPDFVLHNIHSYKKKTANLKDFEGRWLVLDFWNKYCGACVASFPHVNGLQRNFEDKVQFMLVGIQDEEGEIEPMYEQFRQHENLTIPVAFDSLLAMQFDIFTAPYIIVIDPQGIVRAITIHLSKEDVEGLLMGKNVALERAYRVHEEIQDNKVSFDNQRPFLIGGNGGVDSNFLYRSLLSQFDGNKQHFYFPRAISDDSLHGRFQMLGAPMWRLYRYAFFGKYFLDSICSYAIELAIKDSSLFKYSNEPSKNLYNYSLQVPLNRAKRDVMMEIMQRDLENYTGFKVAIEMRPYPCWRLVAAKDTKERLKSKGGIRFIRELTKRADYSMQNYPFCDFFNMLLENSKYPILNETNIDENIDLRFKCFLMDFNDIKRALKEIGLDMLPSELNLKTIVIRDK